MRKNFTLTIAMLLCFFCLGGHAQTQFWSDTFEDAGAPSSGARTPSIAEFSCGGPPFTAYFLRTTGTPAISLQNNGAANYGSIQGSKFWAMEDIDKGPTCTNASISANQQITWSGINITGKSGLSFKGLFAADNIGAWQGSNFGTAQDFIAFEYRIDAGAWTKGIVFYANLDPADTGSSGMLYLETTGDLKGDGPGLTYTLTEYTSPILGTGTTLDIRMNCHANAGSSQELAVDNFRLFETPACTAPVVTANPPNRSICVNSNTTFPSAATGATAYQWQVDTGSGFTDLTNGAPYSGVTTNTLTITAATAGLTTYKYRCKAINGVGTCFTNTNFGTLTVSNTTTTGGQTNISCAGTSTGNASVTPSGGIAPYTYSWAPSGGTGSIATGLAAGNYTVTVTDAIGCTATRNYTITETGTPINLTTGSQTNISCFGGSNGSASVTPSGGTAPYTYSWSPSGGTGATASSLAAGTYIVTVTDNVGCSKTRSYTITQPLAAVSGTTVVTNIACFGGNNGAINLTPTGGTGPYTFNWGGGITTEDRTGLAAGTYSVTITDANGCTGTVSGITVTQPVAAVSGTTVVTNVACFGGNNGAINLTPTGGTGPYTFNWGGGITTEDRTGLAAGTYSVTITDANGCTGTVAGITVTQPVAAVSGTTVVTNLACNGGTNGAINLTPTGGTGPYTFNWGGGITTEDRTGLAAGTYSVTITDTNGCTGTVAGITVTAPTAISTATGAQTNVSCNGGTNGSASVTPSGGTPGYTYSWSPSGGTGATATGLAAGAYTVTVTDANGCTATRNYTITAPTAISTATGSQTNVSCNGGTNGSASVTPSGGTPGYTYSWSPSGGTGATATGLAAGAYTVTVTDANGCTATRNYTITAPTAISTATGSQTNVSCNGGTNGSATVTPSGGTPGYTYSWAPTGGTAATAAGLAAGAYIVTVTDANGCTATRNYTITAPTAISTATGSQTNVSCNGGTNGSASVTPSGGAPGYTYSWSPSGGTAATATGLAAGAYTVTATDANGCTATRNYTITEPTTINTATGSQTNVSCNGGTNGSATVTPSGGTPGYTYSWSPTGGTAATAAGLVAGSYTVTITDANGCTATRNYTITEPATIDSTILLAGATLTANQAGATYQWYECPNTIVPGETSQSFTPTVSGTYRATITMGACSVDSNCQPVLGTSSFEANQKFVIYPNPNSGVVNIKSDFNGDFQIVNQLGQTVKTFKVMMNTVNTINLDNLSDGIYFVRGANETKVSTQRLVIKK